MKRDRPFRLYLDTSVFGGCFDAEFSEASLRVFGGLATGAAILIYSGIVENELKDAPAEVRGLLDALDDGQKRLTQVTAETEELAKAYLKAGVVGPQWRTDCLHVAAATIAHADAIISWNFKHIVNLDRIKAYNEVNVLHGYGILTILSPKEVNFDDIG